MNFVHVLVAGGQSDDDKPRPDPALEAGNALPPRLIDEFPPEYYSKPIEDIDPFYSNQYVSKHHSTSLAGDLHVCTCQLMADDFLQTFVVIGRDNINRFSASNGLFLLSPFNPVRRSAILVLTHSLFGLIIILVIVTNCIFMAARFESVWAERIFTTIYTIEGVLKITARGFILNPFTYLRDAWNWLDFVVVSLA